MDFKQFPKNARDFLTKYKDAKIKVLSYGEVIECVEFDGLAFDVVFECSRFLLAVLIPDVKIRISSSACLLKLCALDCSISPN